MTGNQTAIPCAIFRGGSSRGVYFRREDLPRDAALRDRVLLQILGGPDALQIDGIGGGHPLNNKVAIVGPSERDDADVDYLFMQIIPHESRISVAQNCGNILAGVGPFAIETGMRDAALPTTTIRVHMINSGSLCELTVQTPDGAVNYDGDTEIDGVPGSAAAIVCDFLDIAGSTCGALLPTGNSHDVIDGVETTCIDNGMPVVLVRAADFAVSGYESPQQLDANEELKSKLERLRLAAGPLMNLGDVAEKTVPKLCLIAAPRNGGTVSTRMFIPHVTHRSVGVLGAVSVASACLLPDTVAAGIAFVPGGDEKSMPVEHPAGALPVRLLVRQDDDGGVGIEKAGVIRTARLLLRGEAYVWEP